MLFDDINYSGKFKMKYSIQLIFQVLVKWIFENQHKFQTIRCCNSSLRYKVLEENGQAHQEHVAPLMSTPVEKPRPQLTPDVSFKVNTHY